MVVVLLAQRGKEGERELNIHLTEANKAWHTQPAPPKAVSAWSGRWETHLERSQPQEEEFGCTMAQRLSAVKTLSWPRRGTRVGRDRSGVKGTVSLLLPRSHLVSRGGRKGKKG